MSSQSSSRVFGVLGCVVIAALAGGCFRTSSPTVISTSPEANATNVSVQNTITATFSEAMKPETVTADTFTLSRGATPVAGTVSYSGNTAIFNPSSNLLPNTLYTATLRADVEAVAKIANRHEETEPTIPPGVQEPRRHRGFVGPLFLGLFIAGHGSGFSVDNTLSQDFVWTFTTGSATDTTAPVVSSTTPQNNAMEVGLGGNITATFSEAMNPQTINSATFSLRRGGVAVSGTVSYSGITATFNPSANLAADTVYTARITTGAEDLAGNGLAADHVWTFTTVLSTDVTRPVVVSTTPSNNASDVPSGGNITAMFSELMDPSTINTDTFTVQDQSGGVTGIVSYSGRTATFSTPGGLATDSQYIARITTGAKDLAGNSLASDFVWSFSTGDAPDDVPPTVTSTVPSNGSSNVALGRSLSATFSEVMNADTLNPLTFTLDDGTTSVAGSVSYAGTTATFNPFVDLDANTVYFATITTGAEDLAGNSLASDFEWSFTTGDTADILPPTVTSTVPSIGSIGVPLGQSLSATFSEAMNPATINNQTFILDDGENMVAGTVDYTGVTAVFNPVANLAPNTVYFATITTEAQDLAGNGLLADYEWVFTTGAEVDLLRPTVTGTNPSNGQSNVPLGRLLSATFSKNMNPSTINNLSFQLRTGDESVLGTVSYSGVTATFHPIGDLLPNTVYDAVILNTVRDLAGNRMLADFAWSFTTGDAADILPPVVVSTVPSIGSIDVPVGHSLAATFSEAMNPATINNLTFTLDDGVNAVVGTVNYTSRTALFNPNDDLAPNTVYFATITTEAEDLAGNGMLANYEWVFTTGTEADLVRPTVTGTNPANGQTNVPLDRILSATFSETMDPFTINNLSFQLRTGNESVLGTVSYSGVTATFHPVGGLLPNTVYDATILNTVRDLAGNRMLADFAWSFTTGNAADILPPTVTSTVPSIGSVGVPVGQSLAATFSEPMNPATISNLTFTLDDGVNAVAGTVNYTGVTAVFNPVANLAPNTVYFATITTDAEDLAGNSMLANYEWVFTTGAEADLVRPTVTGTNPANGQSNVPLDRILSATFSKNMNPSTINNLSFQLRTGDESVLGTVSYSGVTATFHPVGNLLPNTVYDAVILNTVRDLAGNSMLANFAWSFTTGNAADILPPTVTSTVPSIGSIGVPVGQSISATFSESMNPATINNQTFILDDGVNMVAGTVDYTGVTAVFNPNADLAPNTVYFAAITADAEDLAGNGMLADYEWVFTTGSEVDLVRPTVTGTNPANGQSNVPLDRILSATFSKNMNPSTINNLSFLLSTGDESVLGTVSYSGVTATFHPVGNLLPNTVYDAVILDTVRDLAGNSMLADFAWSFTTGNAADILPPTVTSTVPSIGSIGVPVSQSLAATFSESMNPATINNQTFTLDDGVDMVAGTVNYTGVTAVFSPNDDLAPNTVYFATITADAEDLAGNGMLADYEWVFTTGAEVDDTPPTVTASNPSNGQTNVPLDRILAVTFSETMNPFTINNLTFLLSTGDDSVLGTVSYSGVTATFHPIGNLLPNTVYDATITTDAEDLAGNSLVSDFEWSFTTGDAADILPPTVTSTVPSIGSFDVPVGQSISATFSEAMNPATINHLTFTLDDGVNLVVGTVTYTGVTAVFNPIADLEPNTIYFATITTEAEDLAGNGLLADYEWVFSTSLIDDETSPEVVFTEPQDGATGVARASNILATFSEAMNPLTVTTQTFLLEDTNGPVNGTVTYAGGVATFNPTVDLTQNTVYFATITTDVEDLAGNPIAEDYLWSFTTGSLVNTTQPTVISTSPIDEAIGVPLNARLTINFSEIMNPFSLTTATINLFGDNTDVVGTVEYTGLSAIFTPNNPLTPNTVYEATVLREASDLADNQMAQDYVWSFTTGDTTAQAQLDLGSAGAFAILAGGTVANTGLSIVNGDLGVSPGDSVVGFPPGVVNGEIFTGVGSAAGQAKEDLTTAYNEAAARSTGAISLPGDLSGLTLFPGLYTNSTSVMLSSGALTLDAQGDSNAVFLLQMGSTLTTGSVTQVILAGGAMASNVYWSVGTSATLGTNSSFVGNVLAEASITLATGANLVGRALTQTASVTLDAAVITLPVE